MTMQITVKKLKTLNACPKAIEELKKHGSCELKELIEKMIKNEYKLDWANWLIVRYMTRKQYISYAVYATEQVIDIYEAKYPNDNRPRKAIEAAKKCINKNSIKNRTAAYAAADAAYAAADAANAAADAANAAYAAADAAYAAANATADAAYAAYAAYVAQIKIQIKILKNGIKLIRKAEEK